MRKIFILSVMLIAGFGACQTKLDDEPPAGDISGESEVELSILTNSATRSTEFSTSDENIIDNLDVLLFDAEKKFVCWRTTFKVNGKLRTTLPVGSGYDAYFLANCRSFIEKMLPDETAISQYKGKADWEIFKNALIDTNPQRLLQNSGSFTSLPMWGMLKEQEVKDGVINYWPLLSLIRSVASVDVYVAADIDNFT